MQEENQNGLSMSAQAAKDAAALKKIASQAASGNAIGAAVTAVKSGIAKKVICVVLSICILIVMCICAVPNMIWEAAEQSRDMLNDMLAAGEDAVESYTDSVYYIFYGTSDGHEGLTGILTALPRLTDTIISVAKAGWEFFTTGEISSETRDSMSDMTKNLVEKIYGTDSASMSETYRKEALAGSLEGDGSTTGMKLAMANKQAATKLRLGGHIDDLKDSIADDFQTQVSIHGQDVNTCHISQKGTIDDSINLILALYMIQTGGRLESVTLAEYDNWLGKSKQTWMETGFFGRDKYREVPKLADGESYDSDELSWEEPIYHWGGEFLPQDVYEEYDRIAIEALEAESRLDYHFTNNDRYQTRQEVLFGKYTMPDESELTELAEGGYEFPDYCTPEAYSVNYGQVWYNPDSNKYYDRGAIDVLVYPSPRIRYTIEEKTFTRDDGSTYTVTYFDAYYTIELVSYHYSDNTWSTDAPMVFGDIIRLTTGKDGIVSAATLTNVSENSSNSASSGGSEISVSSSSSTGSTVSTNGKTGTAYSSSGLRICTDGGTNSYGSSTHQSQTAYTTTDGRYYDGGVVNYIVNPATEACHSSSYGYCVMSHHYNSSWGNCLATVQKKDSSGNPTGQVYFAVVGDAGHQIGEVSLALAKNMGYSYVSGNCGVDESEKFIITIYPDCKLRLSSSSDINLQIKQQGEAYFNS